jgi:hypothetical protein
MGTQTEYTESFSCPCGQGSYSIVHRAGEYGSEDEDWQMNCASCAQSYRLVSHPYRQREGSNSPLTQWVPRTAADELDSLQTNFRSLTDAVDSLMQNKFRPLWHAHFQGISQAAIRDEVADSSGYPSLETFNDQVAAASLESVLDSYLNSYLVHIVERVLQMPNSEATVALKRAQDAQAAWEQRIDELFADMQ